MTSVSTLSMSDSGSESSPTAASDSVEAGVFDTTVSDGVCRLHRQETRFLSTGFDGGVSVADTAYNVTVPEGWPEQSLQPYVEGRLSAAGFDVDPAASPPVLLTGVEQTHAYRARYGPVEAVATAGVSNPAGLPVAGDGVAAGATGAQAGEERSAGGSTADADGESPDGAAPVGTVNVLVGTTRSFAPGALANLVAVTAEAKATTLLATTGFPGTTTDAIVVGSDPTGEQASFSGSATPVGAATRVCVRDAVVGSLRSRYGDDTDATVPETIEAAEHGVSTDESASVEPIVVDGSG